MSRAHRWFLAFLTVVVAAVPASAQLGVMAPAMEVRVPKPPTVTHGGGETILPYELHITNLTTQPFTITRLEVVNADNNAVIATLADSALARAISRVGVRTPPPERAHVGAGLRAVVYMWVPVKGTPPHAIRHRVMTKLDTGSASPTVLETPAVPVSNDLVVIAPPLRGGPWLAANGPSAESGHRRAMIPLSGSYYIAQRFAIDWVKLDARYKTYSGDSLKNSSYYAYGNDALAVADGYALGHIRQPPIRRSVLISGSRHGHARKHNAYLIQQGKLFGSERARSRGGIVRHRPGLHEGNSIDAGHQYQYEQKPNPEPAALLIAQAPSPSIPVSCGRAAGNGYMYPASGDDGMGSPRRIGFQPRPLRM